MNRVRRPMRAELVRGLLTEMHVEVDIGECGSGSLAPRSRGARERVYIAVTPRA
jgi:hypothetical protein